MKTREEKIKEFETMLRNAPEIIAVSDLYFQHL